MLKTINLSKSFGPKAVLRNVSIDLKTDIVGLIGASGAGKSTLLRCLDLIEPIDGGEILLNDSPVHALCAQEKSEIRKRLAVVFQNYNLLSTLTVFDNVALPLRMHGKTVSKAHILSLLEAVSMQAYAHHYPGSLSGGQKQRVAIARALVTNPDVLLLDEPTSALDPQNTQAIVNLLQTIHQERNIAMLVITHHMHTAKQLCSRLSILEAGEIVEEGPVAQLFSAPQHSATQTLVREDMLNLPEAYANLAKTPSAQHHSTVVLVEFFGPITYEPVINRLIHRFYPDLTFNIIQGKIEKLHHEPFGWLVLSISGPANLREQAFALLGEYTVKYDILGYQ